jgi:hypothetical protein
MGALSVVKNAVVPGPPPRSRLLPCNSLPHLTMKISALSDLPQFLYTRNNTTPTNPNAVNGLGGAPIRVTHPAIAAHRMSAGIAADLGRCRAREMTSADIRLAKGPAGLVEASPSAVFPHNHSLTWPISHGQQIPPLQKQLVRGLPG